MGNTIVRENLMTEKNYTPYCGSETCRLMPRTNFNGRQFVCPNCGWVSEFPLEFITEYKNKWNLLDKKTSEPIIVNGGDYTLYVRDPISGKEVKIVPRPCLVPTGTLTRTLTLECSPPEDTLVELPKPYTNGSKFMRNKK